MDFGIASVAAITVICYLAGLAVKLTPWENDKLIPVVCGLVGGLLACSGWQWAGPTSRPPTPSPPPLWAL